MRFMTVENWFRDVKYFYIHGEYGDLYPLRYILWRGNLLFSYGLTDVYSSTDEHKTRYT